MDEGASKGRAANGGGASGQAAMGSYISEAQDSPFEAFALDVLTLRGDRIADITSFINRTTQLRAGDDFLQWPHYPADPARAAAYFEAFGLPDRLA